MAAKFRTPGFPRAGLMMLGGVLFSAALTWIVRMSTGHTTFHHYLSPNAILTLSLIAPIIQRALTVTDATVVINYGLDRVRFPAPLPVGSRWRAGVEIKEVTEVGGGVEVKLLVTVEVEGSEKPALVAETLVRSYR